jgi:hypothetical protein
MRGKVDRVTTVRHPRAGRLIRRLVLGALFACQPPATLPAEPAESRYASVAGRGQAASGARLVVDELAVSAGATLSPRDLWCVTGPDPELERESKWSIEMGRRLDAALPRLSHCTRELPSGESDITVRLVYGSSGISTSQHVVRSSPSACAAAACLMRELGSIPSPPLVIERNSYDIALVLDRGALRRAGEPPDALITDAESRIGCADMAIAALSRSKIKDVVASAFPSLLSCYDAALVRDHDAAGSVTFEFVIGQAGKVAGAQIRDATFPDCSAIQCMLDQFRGLQFPVPVGRSVRIVYPIRYLVEQQPVTLR